MHSKASVEQQLDILLSEPPAAAAERARNELQLDGRRIVVLYGAGTLGMAVLERMRRAGVEPAAFADDTPQKQGTTAAGVPILSPELAAEKFGSNAIFVVTILNPMLRFVDAKKRLQRITRGLVVSFIHLAWALPAAFLPYEQFELPERVLAKRDAIDAAFHLFADDESRRQFIAHLRFRLLIDHAALPENSRADYFPSDVFAPLPTGTVFVDCGAYDGDTVRRFLVEQKGDFGSIHAFEPDPANFGRLRAYVDALDDAVRERIHVYNAAVGDRPGKLRFNTTGNMAASLSESGETEVDVVRVDDFVASPGRMTYVKYDVEGAEWAALRGTDRLIRASLPLLAVSVYHHPDDLWELPRYLDGLALDYRLFLRTQGEDGMDVICYAVPS